MTTERPTYTTRKAAIVGARREIARRGAPVNPLGGVHFTVDQCYSDDGPAWYWQIIDLKTGLPEGVAETAEAIKAIDEAAKDFIEAATEHQPRLPTIDPASTPTPPHTPRPPPGARPKPQPAGVKAYRPKPGTQQAMIYDLLVRPGGTDIEYLCGEINKTMGENTRVPWTPSNAWSGLRYLFCSLKGYGLRFDGRLLWLEVPKHEVSAAKGGAEEG
jgi:hypothetical protein